MPEQLYCSLAFHVAPGENEVHEDAKSDVGTWTAVNAGCAAAVLSLSR